MHQKKLFKQHEQIGEESINGDCISSGFIEENPNLFNLQNPQFHGKVSPLIFSSSKPGKEEDSNHHQQTKKTTHLTIQIPFKSQTLITKTHHESPYSTTILSTPHKRAIMTQTPFLFSQPPASTVVNSNRKGKKSNGLKPIPSFSFSSSCLLTFLSPTSFAIPFATKQLAHKLFRQLLGVRLICFQLRFFILLSLPSFYLFFVFTHRRVVLIGFLSVLAFSLTIVAIHNLAIPRLPSIRLFLARSLPIKLSSCGVSPKSCSKQVVWSIGSKRNSSERRGNSGSWVQVYSNGDVYEGEFHGGKCSGSGVFYYYMKGRYEGDWIDGRYDGYGVETWARGSRYRGQYREGMRHGVGVYRFYTGDLYAGEWSNGQSHGCGVHTCEDGSRYVGEFKGGIKHGFGHYHFRNGDTYAGEYFADKMHGFGVYQFGNGHRYEGAWHEGIRQGFGMYTFKNGDTQSGHWRNGILDGPRTPGGSVNKSKVINSVEEAQRAARRAYDVANVDERVNRTVVAANRSANAARVAAVKAVQNSGDGMQTTPIV